jgi:hypothetical protein
MGTSLRQRSAISRAAHLMQQLLKISILMAVTFSLEMKVIMAELVFDDLLRFFWPIHLVMLPADVDMMRSQRVSSAACPEPSIKHSPVQERFAEEFERDAFHPCLKFTVAHLSAVR